MTPDILVAATGVSGIPESLAVVARVSGVPPAAPIPPRQGPEETTVDTGASKAAGEGVFDDEMLVYGDSLDRSAMDVNMIIFSTDYDIIGKDEEDVSQFDFGLKEVVFTKLIEAINHLKPLSCMAILIVCRCRTCWSTMEPSSMSFPTLYIENWAN